MTVQRRDRHIGRRAEWPRASQPTVAPRSVARKVGAPQHDEDVMRSRGDEERSREDEHAVDDLPTGT